MIEPLTPSQAERQAFADWLDERPQVIRDLAAKYDPYVPYRIVATRQIGWIVSYSEDGTVRLAIPAEAQDDPFCISNIQVFGVDPESLTRLA